MMIFVPAIILIVLMSLTLYLHLAGAFTPVHPRASQVAVYILLAFFALTIGIGIFYSGPTITSGVGSNILGDLSSLPWQKLLVAHTGHFSYPVLESSD